ncbi:alpha/beta hydrolase [Ruegeria sp. 2205SS24-7]|uniref:alpha/beta fold hydrolase n=1 Tax=Ruegeria discodermiae TaxID=3064389 RepID=UPI0027417269|nr:alpha/beta hydrolase [Ruegeria sp. 2205SS24-7]MDP5219033.1 alpha/beta hydrolase [Ruegeria sp. 2205SS24-7]
MTMHISADYFPCIDRGTGAPILFVHGAACDHRIWVPHIQDLSQRHRCIAPTLRWFGRSQWPATTLEFSEKTHAGDLATIIEGLDCGPVFVVGWSYGANVALRLSVDRPDLITGVAAYEPSSTSLVSEPLDIAMHQLSMQETFFPVTEAAAAGDGTGVLKAFIGAVGGSGTFGKLPPDLRQICLDNAHTLIPLLSAKQRFASVTAAELETLAMPVHVAWGEQSGDLWTIPSKAAARLTHVHGHAIHGADHIWPAKDPMAFLRWLDGVLHLGSKTEPVCPETLGLDVPIGSSTL